MRCAGASHSHSQRRLELQIVQPVDRFDVDTLLLAAVPDIERNRGTGGTDGPHLAIKIRKAARRFASDTDDFVAFAQPGLLARPAWSEAADRETPGGVVCRNAKPRTPAARDAAIRDQVAKDRRQLLDRHEHVARRCFSGAGRVADDQRADADELAVTRNQRRTAP